jgi:DNA-binding LytR/AlgR family response regulator
MKIIIIEDEELTADDLASSIKKADSEAEIVGVLNTVKQAVSYFSENIEPDLIFSDIQLGDGLSFEIFRQHPVTSPVIFCTAYDEYALRAFKTNGIDYILKPFSAAMIREAINKYKSLRTTFLGHRENISKIYELFESSLPGNESTVLVFHRENIIPVKTSDIALFYIENEITYLLTFANKQHTIDKSLEELESISGKAFFRANRQFLINRAAVTRASHYFSRKLTVTLSIPFEKKILISREKISSFLTWLSGK